MSIVSNYAACPHFFGQLESICISMNKLRCARCQELKFGEQLSHSNAHRSVSRNFACVNPNHSIQAAKKSSKRADRRNTPSQVNKLFDNVILHRLIIN